MQSLHNFPYQQVWLYITFLLCIEKAIRTSQLIFGPSIDNWTNVSWLKVPIFTDICFKRFSAFALKRNSQSIMIGEFFVDQMLKASWNKCEWWLPDFEHPKLVYGYQVGLNVIFHLSFHHARCSKKATNQWLTLHFVCNKVQNHRKQCKCNWFA